MGKLGEYRRKRRPDVTNEPFGGEHEDVAERERGAPGEPTSAYVVHLHDATRRHYDVRLEVGGVLWSFAVPRGPSTRTSDKHLAVKTEDHPIEYLEFEDVIPAGQYGGGPMIAWDRGTVTWLEGPPEEELARGKLHMRLTGLKLRGAYAFVKLKKSAKGNEWLFFKKEDAYSDETRDLPAEQPWSVLSGLTVEELEDAAQRGATLERAAEDAGGKRLTAKTRAALLAPATSPLMRTTAGGRAAAAVFDAELEGTRVLAIRDGDRVALLTEAMASIEEAHPTIVRALRALPVTDLALDGTVAVLADDLPPVLVASDLLALGGRDTRPLALDARRRLLAMLLPGGGFVRAAPPLEGDLATVLATCKALGIARVVAKPRSAAYGKGTWHAHDTGAPPRSRAPAIARPAPATKTTRAATTRHVPVTNPKKVFWPESGLTKGDLCGYYAGIADVILPYLRARPVIVVRYPDGIDGKHFYQWNVPPGMPPWIRTLVIQDEEGGTKRGFLVDDPETLLYIANLGSIPLHILAARAPALDRADFFTIDFDIKQSELRHAITLARTLKQLLDVVGLPGLPKTSGQTGLHVLCPLGPGHTFATARGLADVLGRFLVAAHPDIATMERIVKRRGPKVYVDTGQTGETRAIVAPYSVRAVPGATVSTPLTWDEVTNDLDPRAFTLKTVPARIAKRGDLMVGLLSLRPDVPRAVRALDGLASTSR